MVSNVQMRTETADYYQRRIYAHFSSFSTRAILLSDHIFLPCSTSSVTSSHLTSKTSTTPFIPQPDHKRIAPALPASPAPLYNANAPAHR